MDKLEIANIAAKILFDNPSWSYRKCILRAIEIYKERSVN